MLEDGDEEVGILSVVYHSGTVSISSLGYFSSVGSSSKPSHPYFTLSLIARHIQEYFNNKRRGEKNPLSHSMRNPGML